jgi:general stress protein 26
MEWKDLCVDFMRKAEVVCVSTMNTEGYPETRAMFNLYREDQFPGLREFLKAIPDFTVYLTTNTSSRKIAQIRANPRANLYYSLPEQWFGFNLVGTLMEVNDPEIRSSLWQPGWEIYYPGGWKDPDYAVLKLNPHQARCYYQLQTFEFNL